MLLILSTILIITATVLIWSYKRRPSKQVNNSSPYSTLNRRAGQPQHLQQDSADLYDQIHLSPSTGQTEYIPNETANLSQTSQNSHPTHSTVSGDIVEHSSNLNTAKVTTSQLSSQKAHESTSEQPTYAAVDRSKKKKFKKKDVTGNLKAAEKGPPITPYAGHEVPSAFTQEKKENAKQEINSPHTIEELYTAVKKPKVCEPKGDEEIPPPHIVEELYTAVQKKPKSRSHANDNKDETATHTEEEIHTAGEKPPQILKNTTEDLYTTVMKKPHDGDGSADDTEVAPPIPPHTMEELYTARQKEPKGYAEDKKEAPPIPPYTMEEN
jgi:hypothetical protein